MVQAKHQYFHKGEAQKRADITVDLRRLDKKKIAKWTTEERKHLKDFIISFEASFNAFKTELYSLC